MQRVTNDAVTLARTFVAGSHAIRRLELTRIEVGSLYELDDVDVLAARQVQDVELVPGRYSSEFEPDREPKTEGRVE